MRKQLDAAFLLLILLLARAAFGQPAAVHLDLQKGAGTEHCPEEVALRDAVAARLGYDPFSMDAKRVVRVTITRKEQTLTATVELSDESGQSRGSRQMKSEQNDCVELASAMTLGISIAIDPVSSLRSAPSAAPPTSTPPPPPPPQPPPPSRPSATAAPPPVFVPRPTPETPVPISPRAGLDGVVSWGSAPAAAAGLRAWGGIRRDWLSLSLEGRGDFSASKTVPNQGTVSASVLLGSLTPCVHTGHVQLCAIASFGAIRGVGQDIDRPRQKTTFFSAAGARVGLELPVHEPFFVAARVDGLATLTRTRLELSGQHIWTTAPVMVTLGLGAGVQFP